MTAEAVAEAQALLQSITLDEYLFARPPAAVFSLPPTASLSIVLQQLSARNILSAPLLSPDGTYHGFIDVLDVASALFERFSGPISAPQLHSLEEFLRETEAQDCPRANDAQMVLSSHGGLSLLEVIRKGFITPPFKLWSHRIAIFSQDSEPLRGAPPKVTISAIFSQTDAVAFIHLNLSQLPSLRDTPLRALGVGAKDVFTVSHDMPAADAFRGMLGAGATSCAVVQDDNMVAALSPSDLRGLLPEDWRTLRLPVLEYLVDREARRRNIGGLATAYGVRPHSLVHEETSLSSRPAVCSLDTTVGDALEIIVSRRVHRLFIIERAANGSDGKLDLPLGVLSLTDLLFILIT